MVLEKDKKENLSTNQVPYDFNNAEQLLSICNEYQYNIYDIVLENELSFNNIPYLKNKSTNR